MKKPPYLKSGALLLLSSLIAHADIPEDQSWPMPTYGFNLGNTLEPPNDRSSALKFTVPHFTGYRFALFYYSTQTAGGRVDFDYFRIGARNG